MANSLDSGQPARNAQADLGRYFLLLVDTLWVDTFCRCPLFTRRSHLQLTTEY